MSLKFGLTIGAIWTGGTRLFGLFAKQSASLAGAFLAPGKPLEVAATSINALLLKLGTADK